VKKRIAEVIGHELWHMWSGNLVTMKWWNDLWLNESFANYMAFKALHYYFPEWNIWEYHLESETLGALDADSLKTTHPISVEVKSPNEIEELFDEISYGKGGSVLRMIDSFLGEETFKKGVGFYLDKFKYSNAEADDFWNCLSRFSKENIKKIAKSWINQPGYPLLKVESRGKKLVIEQEAFQDAFKGQRWLIPLTIRPNGETKTVVLKKRRQKIRLDSEYFKLNHDQTGFFRVKYSKRDLKNLKNLVKNNKISSIDLFGICNDLFYLALYGKISVDHYIEFIKLCKDEKDYLVLAEIHRSLYKIDRIFSNLSNWNLLFKKLNSQIEEVFINAFSNLGWNPRKQEMINETLLRPVVISNLSLLRNEKIIEEGKRKFNSFHKDVRSSGYGLIASNGNELEYEKILNKYRKEKDVEEKKDLLVSLYRFEDLELLKKSLNLIFSGEVRLQDYPYIFYYIRFNKRFRELFLNFVRENWNKFNEHKDSFFIFSRFLDALIITNLDKLGEVHNFLKDKEILYQKTKEEAFENAKVQKRFLDKNAVIIEKYLSRAN
ncbi:MAG: M1 family metallopeptidase, partial [Candidatus Nanoarchaeia archaeon]